MPAPRRRLHRVASEEDASQLKLDTLTTSEAKLLIDVVLQKRPRDTGEEMPMTDTFARFQTTEAIHAVERGDAELHKFEIAQLGSLCPEEAEEAKTLIPSLVSKKTDEDLQAILDELSSLRKFQ